MLCTCERVASVDGVVVVQHGYEMALSRPVGRHSLKLAAFFYAATLQFASSPVQ